MEFILTNHLRQRYVERFENKKHYDHLSICDKDICQICKDLAYDLHEETWARRSALNEILTERLSQAHEEKAYLNNSVFMQGAYERYGYGRFTFLVDGDVLFVVLINEEGNIVPTCIPARESVIGQIVARPKYRKRA